MTNIYQRGGWNHQPDGIFHCKPSSYGGTPMTKRNPPMGHWEVCSGWWFGTFFIFQYIGNFIIPTDFHIFQRGGQPPTSYHYCIYYNIRLYKFHVTIPPLYQCHNFHTERQPWFSKLHHFPRTHAWVLEDAITDAATWSFQFPRRVTLVVKLSQPMESYSFNLWVIQL